MDICKRNASVGEMLVEDMNVHRLSYADDSVKGRETECKKCQTIQCS